MDRFVAFIIAILKLLSIFGFNNKIAFLRLHNKVCCSVHISLCRLLFRVMRQEIFPSEVLRARALEKQDLPYCSCLHKTAINDNDNNSSTVEPVSFSRVQANHNDTT